MHTTQSTHIYKHVYKHLMWLALCICFVFKVNWKYFYNIAHWESETFRVLNINGFHRYICQNMPFFHEKI